MIEEGEKLWKHKLQRLDTAEISIQITGAILADLFKSAEGILQDISALDHRLGRPDFLFYLDNCRVGIIELFHQDLQGLKPVVYLSAFDNGCHNVTDGFTDIGICNVLKTAFFDVAEHRGWNHWVMRFDIILERKTSNRTYVRILLRHLGQDVHEV